MLGYGATWMKNVLRGKNALVLVCLKKKIIPKVLYFPFAKSMGESSIKSPPAYPPSSVRGAQAAACRSGALLSSPLPPFPFLLPFNYSQELSTGYQLSVTQFCS